MKGIVPAAGLTLRPATPADAPALVSLYNRVAHWMHSSMGITEQWDPQIPDDEIRQMIATGEAYVAVIGDVIAGAVRLSAEIEEPWENSAQDALYVHSLAVAREYAGMDVGRRILDWAAEVARRAGKTCLRLDCMAENPRLRRYYAGAGFCDLGQHPRHTWYALFERRVAQ